MIWDFHSHTVWDEIWQHSRVSNNYLNNQLIKSTSAFCNFETGNPTVYNSFSTRFPDFETGNPLLWMQINGNASEHIILT